MIAENMAASGNKECYPSRWSVLKVSRNMPLSNYGVRFWSVVEHEVEGCKGLAKYITHKPRKTSLNKLRFM